MIYLLQLVVPALVTIALGSLAGWRRSWGVSWIGLAVGAALALVPGFVLEGLPDYCSEEDGKAFSEWVESGGKGPMPADCETY